MIVKENLILDEVKRINKISYYCNEVINLLKNKVVCNLADEIQLILNDLQFMPSCECGYDCISFRIYYVCQYTKETKTYYVELNRQDDKINVKTPWYFVDSSGLSILPIEVANDILHKNISIADLKNGILTRLKMY